MSWPLSFKWEGKPQFCSVKTYASEHNLPPEKELIGTNSILAPGKSQVLPTDPLFTCKTDYIYNLADRRSAIKRQEGGIAALKVCLKALPLSPPSPPNFFALSPNREPVHRLYVAYSKIYKEKKERAEHTLRLKSDIQISKVAIYQNKRNVIGETIPPSTAMILSLLKTVYIVPWFMM